MNLYEKIVKIMSEVQSLKKDGKISFGTTKYNFLSEAKTTGTLRERFVEYGIMVYPVKAEETISGKVTHGHYTFRMVNAEKPEEYIDIQSTGQGQDSSDKGSGKAQSYAFKYALWRTFAIPSNDDPDQISSAEHIEEERKHQETINKKIDPVKLQALEELMIEVDADVNGFNKYFKIDNTKNLTVGRYSEAVKMLEAKRSK